MANRPWFNRILALGLIVCLSGCSQPSQSPDSSASASEPDASLSQPQSLRPLSLAYDTTQSLHPILTHSRVNQTLTPLLYQGLFCLDPAFNPQPVLCKSYSVSEDALVWTFDLRRDVTFSDGTPLTAQPVLRSLELARGAGSPYAGRFSTVRSISAQGSHQLIVTLSRPNGGLPALLDVPIVLGDGERPLGTGPYTPMEREGSLLLTPRQDSLPPITLYSITQPEQLIGSLEQHSVSLVATDPTATDAPGFSGTYSMLDYDTTSLIYLGFNTVRSPFHTAANRAAAAAAVDRNPLVSAAWAGHGSSAALPFHPASPLYDESLTRSLPGPDAAKELVAQAAFSDRKLTLLVNQENSGKVTAAQLLARQLETAGLSVTVSALPWSEYLNALNSGQFDLYLGEVTLTADFDLTALLSGSGSINYSRWRSGEFDRLLTEFLNAPEADRPTAASHLSAHLTEQMPIIPLCFKRNCVLTCWENASQLTPTRANAFFGLF